MKSMPVSSEVLSSTIQLDLPSEHHCPICVEIGSKSLPSVYRSTYQCQQRICIETEAFVAVPSISPLVSGHMLIFPKEHVKSLSELTSHRLSQLATTAELVTKILGTFNQKLFFFEHGIAVRSDGGCGISHAHLHILPLREQVTSIAVRETTYAFGDAQAGDLISLLSRNAGLFSYLMFGTNIENLNICFSESIPSQFMRRQICKTLGSVDADWKKLTNVQEFGNTLDLFGGFTEASLAQI